MFGLSRPVPATTNSRPAKKNEALGDPAAGQCREVNARGVEPVDGGGRLVIEAEAAALHLVHHEQHEQRPHAVVAQPLPHLGEEQRVESARMAGSRGRGALHGA
jgi:hypothetical protein